MLVSAQACVRIRCKLQWNNGLCSILRATWVFMWVLLPSTVRYTKTCLNFGAEIKIYIKFSRQLQIIFFRHRFHWRKWIRPDVNIISSGICYGYMSKLKMPGFSITKTQIIWPRVARQVVTTLKISAYCKKPLPFELRIPRKLCFQVDKTHQTNHYQTITRVKEGFQFRYFCRLNQFLCELSLVF